MTKERERSEVVIVPCTKEKVWDDEPGRGKVPAKDAYASTDFQRWRSYAESLGRQWFILSTEYGLIEPDKRIGPYEATVSEALADRAFHALLRRQARELELTKCDQVILLSKKDGSKKFAALVRLAIPDPNVKCVKRRA